MRHTRPSRPARPRFRTHGACLLGALALLSPLVVACGDDSSTSSPDGGDAACAPAAVPATIDAETVAGANTDGTTIRLVTHDSFAVSDGTFDAFEAETGITVDLLQSGDAGTLVSQSVLTAGKPVADVLFGIDNTFLCRGLKGDVFVPYESPGLADVPDELELDPNHLVTPIDVGDVCVNFATGPFDKDTPPPANLDDLTKPAFADQFVTENPETSSPGFAFLLATIAAYGEDGWEDYWQQLRDNGLEVANGWEEAYYESFGAGSGERTIVTSYATSPVADVVFSDPPRDAPAIGVMKDGCFRQIEFAGVLRGTEHPEAAAKLVDFLLSPTFQEDIPLNMFVGPANETATLPEPFVRFGTTIDAPMTLDPATIEAGREAWTERWTEIVLR